MWWIFGGKFSVNIPQEKWAINLSPKTSPHSSLQEKKCVTWNSLWDQDFHFLLQDPRTLELILKPWEASRIIDFDAFLKGFQRVLEGVLKGL